MPADLAAGLRPSQPWTGRVDGPGSEHARWHTWMRPWAGERGGVVLVGFASDEGVRRNHGRPGAAESPAALRSRLAPLAHPGPPPLSSLGGRPQEQPRPRGPRGMDLFDAGDVVVLDGDLERAQERLGARVRAILAAGCLPVVLGGGHDVAFGSYLGWAGDDGWGILNLDAHFDLRAGVSSTSGTPFLQVAEAERARGRAFRYGVLGVAEAANTRALFDTADAWGVRHLPDDECSPEASGDFARSFTAGVDRVHLTIDLDALPAGVAPGVSAPAGFGISLDAVRAAVRTVAASGRLGLVEVAELNPTFDIDGRTARTGAHLIDEAVRLWGRAPDPRRD